MKSTFKQNEEPSRVELALILSALPYRRGFYRNGGWKRCSSFQELHRYAASQFGSLYSEARNRALDFLNSYNIENTIQTDYGKTEVRFIYEVDYPQQLLQIFDSPSVLFITGYSPAAIIEKWNQYNSCLAIVGTRDPEPISLHGIRFLLQTIKSNEPLLVSGLARGIDYEAHRCAVDQGIASCGVIASGILEAGPYQSRKLLKDAYKNRKPFAALSEVFPSEIAAPYQFPRRNRLISGLSSSVVLMQAPVKSGAMITADYAIEHNRDLYCFDHELFDRNTFNDGCRKLLSEGAELLEIEQFTERIKKKPDSSNPDAEFAYYHGMDRGTVKKLSDQLYLDLSET